MRSKEPALKEARVGIGQLLDPLAGDQATVTVLTLDALGATALPDRLSMGLKGIGGIAEGSARLLIHWGHGPF
jgi:hypothetical protein